MNLWCINFRGAIHLRFSAKGIHQEMKLYESSVYKFSISDFFPSLNQHSQNINMLTHYLPLTPTNLLP
jgi:hypothetical protein